MPRKSHIVKPGTRKYGIKSNYSSDTLEEALAKIKDCGLSINSVSKLYKIPRKNKLLKKHELNVGRPTALSGDEEKVITKHTAAPLPTRKVIIETFDNSVAGI